MIHAAYLLQMMDDIAGLMGQGPDALCRLHDHGGFVLSGAMAADLNMGFLTRLSPRAEFDEMLAAVRARGAPATLLIEDGADEVRHWAAAAGLRDSGRMPVMERPADPVDVPPGIAVRRAAPAEMAIGNRLAAAAFGLDETQCHIAMPAAALANPDNELWIAEIAGAPVGCGLFIRTGHHVGVYRLSVAAAHQRRGVGGAVLAAAMADHLDTGADRFTLGATPTGQRLCERLGFRVVSQPHIHLIGAAAPLA
ncbi:MAG: GNAT family N-acetyltransferase [Sphingomonadales bacterium]|jgi:GNAT superfamily N-acetyltransferase